MNKNKTKFINWEDYWDIKRECVAKHGEMGMRIICVNAMKKALK